MVGQNTTIEDFDLSPDGAGLSGRVIRLMMWSLFRLRLHLWLLRVIR